MIEGTVRNLTNYGAFIEIEEGIDGLLHISDMSWTRKIGHPNEVLEKGQRISCQVLNVDQERKRIALGLKQLRDDPWETDIPNRYEPGDVVKGKVTKLTNFGVFVELEPGLEGLLHISELADHKVDSPEEVVKVGDEIEVKILRVDRGERKIGLSRKKAQWTKADDEDEGETPASAADRPRVPSPGSRRSSRGASAAAARSSASVAGHPKAAISTADARDNLVGNSSSGGWSIHPPFFCAPSRTPPPSTLPSTRSGPTSRSFSRSLPSGPDLNKPISPRIAFFCISPKHPRLSKPLKLSREGFRYLFRRQ